MPVGPAGADWALGAAVAPADEDEDEDEDDALLFVIAFAPKTSAAIAATAATAFAAFARRLSPAGAGSGWSV